MYFFNGGYIIFKLNSSQVNLLTHCFSSCVDDLSSKDVSSHELLKAELRLLPHTAKMETYTHVRVSSTLNPAAGSGINCVRYVSSFLTYITCSACCSKLFFFLGESMSPLSWEYVPD